jgi:hypothetical protein
VDKVSRERAHQCKAREKEKNISNTLAQAHTSITPEEDIYRSPLPLQPINNINPTPYFAIPCRPDLLQGGRRLGTGRKKLLEVVLPPQQSHQLLRAWKEMKRKNN